MDRGNQEIVGPVRFHGDQVAVAKLARTIGAAKAVLLRKATREGVAERRPCRTAGGVQMVTFVPTSWAEAVAERYALAEANMGAFA